MRRLSAYLSMGRSPSAIFELDGLRGIAILLVLGRHATRVFDVTQPIFPIGRWDAIIPFVNGWAGVDLFFVLSGFLITYHILRRWTLPLRGREVRVYLAKRFLRIAPAYYAVVLIVALGWIPFFPPPAENLGLKVAYHLLFLQDYFPPIVVAFWSLGVEEKFYLTIPFVVLLLWQFRDVRVQLGILCALAIVPPILRQLTYVSHGELDTYLEYFRFLRSPFHVSLDCLLVGSICALLHYHRERFPWLDRPAVIRGLFFGGALLSGLLLFPRPLLAGVHFFNVTLLYSLLGLGFGAVCLSLVSGRAPFARFFRSRVLFFFSKISYSLYLVHMIFMARPLVVLRHVFHIGDLPLGAQFAIYFPVFCAVSTLVALLLHYLVEKPFLLLKDRL